MSTAVDTMLDLGWLPAAPTLWITSSGRRLDVRDVGFDPTGDSFHIGHLLPVMAMAHLQQAGHKPIVVLGGGTAMVGDPSGKDKTREILTPEKIRSNLEAMRLQFARFLDLDGCEVVDNAEWLMGLGYIHFLRDVGRHFSVNKMMSAEGIKQ